MFWWPIVIAFVIGYVLTYYFATPGAKLRIIDHPNERSLHARPTPRTGGIAILLGIVVGSVLMAMTLGIEQGMLWIGSAGVAVAVISFFDDMFGLSATARLLTHTMLAIVLVTVGLDIEQLSLPGFTIPWAQWLGMIITVGYLVWMINLYNFMDGMDGFAGGMTVIGFGVLGLVGWMEAEWWFSIASWSIAASALGFLVWNFPPARIFLGDAGSSTLGFLVAAFTVWADQQEVVPIWISILVFSPFIVDATVTLVRRIIRREPIWEAHRSHYYQRLALRGWGHRRTVLWEYALMLACASSAILVARAGPDAMWPWWVIAGWTGVYLALALAADRYAPFGKEDVTCQGS